MSNKGERKKKRVWLWALISLAAGLVLGCSISLGVVLTKQQESTGEFYSIAKENGYSGNSSQKLVSPIQTDEAIARVSEKLKGSVVTVLMQQRTGGIGGQAQVSVGLGSGVIYKEETNCFYVITNAHVVNGADKIMLYYSDDEMVPVTLQGLDVQSDIAVLRLAKSDVTAKRLAQITCAEFGDSDALRIGETAIAIGSPQGTEFSYSVSAGAISGLHREVEVEGVTMSYIQTDAAINPGNSGGALLDADGKVIGITSAKIASDDVEGVGFAIPINTALEVVKELMDHGYVEWLTLGLSEYEFLPKALADAYHVPTGIVVYGVTKNGPAEKAGIRKGDIITAIDGKALESAEEVQKILESYKAGDTVKLTVIRNRNAEAPLTLEAVLMAESDIKNEQGGSFWGDR